MLHKEHTLFVFSHLFITFGRLIKIIGTMSLLRAILAIICPPLAVLDKGCGSILIVFILTLLGFIPGIIAALIIVNKQ